MTSSLRVLLAVESLAAGGTERMTVDLANWLAARGHEVTLCSIRGLGPLASDVSPAVSLRSAGRNKRVDVAALRRFAKMVRAPRPDVVHGMGRSATIFAAAATLLVRRRPPLVLHDHHWEGPDARPGLPLRLAARASLSWYIGVDRRVVEWARRHLPVPGDRVTLLPNAIDVDRFPASVGHAGTDVVFVMVANLRAPKDHETLIRAIGQSSRRARIRLVIVGAPVDREIDARCRAAVEALGLADRVEFVGQRTDVAALLEQADCGVLSSTSETGPVAVLEYCAAGLPVVATDTGEVVERLRSDGIGWFVPVGDVGALAAALDRVVAAGPAEREEMGQRARAVVRERFSPDTYVDGLVEIYEHLKEEAEGQVSGRRYA